MDAVVDNAYESQKRVGYDASLSLSSLFSADLDSIDDDNDNNSDNDDVQGESEKSSLPEVFWHFSWTVRNFSTKFYVPVVRSYLR